MATQTAERPRAAPVARETFRGVADSARPSHGPSLALMRSAAVPSPSGSVPHRPGRGRPRRLGRAGESEPRIDRWPTLPRPDRPPTLGGTDRPRTAPSRPRLCASRRPVDEKDLQQGISRPAERAANWAATYACPASGLRHLPVIARSLPGGLGGQQAVVGGPEQRGDRGALGRRDRQPDRGGQRPVGPDARLADRRDDAVRGGDRLVGVGARQDHRELLAAGAADHVGAADRRRTGAPRRPAGRASPTGWPWPSLTALKSSTSSSISPTGSPERRARASSDPSRSWKWRRLKSPVSSSVRACSDSRSRWRALS